MLGEGKRQDYLADIVQNMIYPLFERAVVQMKEKGLVHKDVDITLIRISDVSLMFFPMISKVGQERAEDFELNKENVERLVKQNVRLIESGCFVQA